MKLLNDIIASIQEDAPVRQVLVGAHWTVVCSRHCGMASTILGNKPHGHEKVRDVGQLENKSALELAEYARSDNLLEASIGIAAINSLLEIDVTHAVEVNAAEVLLNQGKGKNIALVGHFPFIPKLRQAAGQLWVIEQNPTDNEYPAKSASDLIPQADLVRADRQCPGQPYAGRPAGTLSQRCTRNGSGTQYAALTGFIPCRCELYFGDPGDR